MSRDICVCWDPLCIFVAAINPSWGHYSEKSMATWTATFSQDFCATRCLECKALH